MAQSSLIRVNARGIKIFPNDCSLRLLGDLGWCRLQGNTSARAFCDSEIGSVFPVLSSTLRAAADKNTLPKAWQDNLCSQSSSHVLVKDAAYDVGSCDILDEGMDLVLVGDTTLFVLKNQIDQGTYWSLVVCAILLVRGLSKNIRTRMTTEEEQPNNRSQDLSLLACMLTVILVSHEGNAIYATERDLEIYIASLAYTVLYMVYHLGHRIYNPTHTPPVYNLAAGKQYTCLRF